MTGLKTRRISSWDDVPREWHDHKCAATPFQTDTFLKAWYATLGRAPGVEPIIVEVRDASDRPMALWPMTLKQNTGLREIGIADGGVADNCAPLIGEAFPKDTMGFAALWRETLNALPSADLLRLEKMPGRLLGAANPMATLSGVVPDNLSRHIVDMPGTFDEYSAARTTKFSKEQRRVWRVFTRNENATFEIIRDSNRANTLLPQFERLQESRMREIGATYRLGDPVYRSFAKELILRGVEDGSVVFGALTCGDELVGGLIGVTDGRDITFVRICFAPGAWAVCSPGRLVLEKTIEKLHEMGFRAVDLSIGEFPYKKDFGIRPEPLYALIAPLSLRGRPAWAASVLRQRLKKSAWVRALRDKWIARRRPDAA